MMPTSGSITAMSVAPTAMVRERGERGLDTVDGSINLSVRVFKKNVGKVAQNFVGRTRARVHQKHTAVYGLEYFVFYNGLA